MLCEICCEVCIYKSEEYATKQELIDHWNNDHDIDQFYEYVYGHTHDTPDEEDENCHCDECAECQECGN